MQYADFGHLVDVFSALADPTRLAIVARLSQGEATVNELAQPFGFAQPTISRHLKVLEKAGLIETSRDAQHRPRKLVATEFNEIAKWIEPFLQQWNARFDQLELFLNQSPKQEKTHARKRRKTTKRKTSR